ncbi:class B sortase [Halalkalibacter akibai]|uniref:NPQTN specific sortase B n=1 Tax=Halalkalibacter akibai (strain ATCC 43226 / DSM 21942 / CIP 109018 / JCM 9157 / 1139) TaxID=1236973 RepID=W4QQ07_HALA3|nr:class B sortase [Halalkalibacter akibai]GAE34161.1 NPQTN specific sortase B [Halalkalibacter akibai JCM 9157]
MIINRLILLLFIALFAFSMFHVFQSVYASYQTNQTYEQLREEHSVQPLLNEKTVKEESNKTEELITFDKFEALLKQNKDTIGWITIPNTKIDYPVVQTDNNDFYLDHDFHGRSSEAGTIFMDYRNAPELTQKNTILYGHHMRDGSMFKDLVNYQDNDFFQENQIITIQTLHEETKWEVFSAYVTDTSYYYIEPNFRSNRDYLQFLQEVGARSVIQKSLNWNEVEQILTLSTCSYEFNDARFVVHARRVMNE